MGDICKLLGTEDRCESRDSSLGRAEDCSISQTEILRSIVLILLNGINFPFLYHMRYF